MSIFDEQSQTQTEIETGLSTTDYSVSKNYQGSAPINGTITQDNWLPSTIGMDCKLVHGDRWQELKGNLTENISSSVVTTIGSETGAAIASSLAPGSWSISVAGNEDITIYGNLTQEVYGESTYLFVDKTDTTHVNSVTNDYQSSDSTNQPTQNFQVISWTGLATGFQFTVAALIIQAFAAQVSGGLVYNFSAALINHTAGIVCPSAAVVDDEAHLTKSQVRSIKNSIGMLENDLYGLTDNVVGLTLFAGALLGANQIM